MASEGAGRRAAAPSANKAWLRALSLSANLTADASATLARRLDALAETYGETAALLSDDQTLNFAELAERTRRYARWAISQGLGRGDGVALLMPNRPEYAAVWLGLSRRGVVVSLLNANLRGEALAHSLKVSAPKLLIVDKDRLDALASLGPLGGRAGVWIAGRVSDETLTAHGAQRLDEALEAASGAGFQPWEEASVELSDPALHIFTSGTTGLPKAAIVSHRRILAWSGWFAGLMDSGPGDRLYNCLPMYHSVGGVVAVGALLVSGGAVVVREKFSARDFWGDVRRWDCTIFQYIGELCRYLLASPPDKGDGLHRLRLACGNGLREDVWIAFQERFAIPQILEFYAATEGTFSLYNVEGKPGAIGRVPGFLAHRFGVEIVAHDPETGQPWRGPDGFCRRCAPGEAGEAIGRIAGGEAGGARFEGYTDEGASAAKVLTNVLEPSDAYFRSGDLMRRDAQGFYYFVDRVGDTYRWKGENVSTGEVEAALSMCRGVQQACVYGVVAPGSEGRAGMAAIVAGPGFDPSGVGPDLEGRLPSYARPVFLRLVATLEATDTFKPKKAAMAAEGFNPAVLGEDVWFYDPSRERYAPLDGDVYRAICAGEVRL